MDSTGQKVLIIGPGFIGWNILDLLVAEGYSVTCFARRQSHADALKASGATKVVLGDLDDKAMIKELAEQHEIIFHTATADHLPSVQAVLDGLEMVAMNGEKPIFIHTSGTSVLDDGAEGRFKGEKIYSDERPEELDSLADSAPHREIDLAIKRAAEGDLGMSARMAIMIPPLIYGWTHDRGTIQIPTLTRFALKHGYVPTIGEGKAVESNIHVLDLARAYITLLHHLEASTPEKARENIYYFCESTGDNEPSWHEVATHIGTCLHQANKINDAEPRTLDRDSGLWGDLFGDLNPAVVGLNSRSRADRLRKLGWEPREKDWRKSYVEDELPNLLGTEVGVVEGAVEGLRERAASLSQKVMDFVS